MTILGTKGRLDISRPFNQMNESNRFLLVDEKGKETWVKYPKYDLYTGEVDDLCLSIQENREPFITLEETRYHIRTLLALYQSAREDRVVHL